MAEYGQPGEMKNVDSQDIAGNFGGDDWHYQITRQFLHEPLSQAGLYRLQRPHSRTQIFAECDSARSYDGRQC